MAWKLRKIIAEKVVSSLAEQGLGSGSPRSVDLTKHCIRVNPKQRYHLVARMHKQSPQLILSYQSLSEAFNVPQNSISKDMLVDNLCKSLSKPSDIIEDIVHPQTPYPCIGFNINKSSFIKEVLNTYKEADVFQNFRTKSCILSQIKLQKILVEYSSPNIAKVFHVGHLRSTILGQFIANLCAFLDHQVVRINYLGDWGTQYGLLSAGFERFGSEECLKNNAILHLLEVYIKANELAETDEHFRQEARSHFRNLEEGNSEIIEQWEKFRNLSIQEYNKMYKRLGVEFDFYHGESMYSTNACTVIEYLLNQGLAHATDDGTIVYKLSGASEQTVTIRKSDGSTLYISRDVAAAIDRKYRYSFDKAFYVVSNAQTDHFKALKIILKDLGYDWANTLHHIKFGLIRGMSTRKGQIVSLDALLSEAQNLALEGMKQSQNCTVTEGYMEETADILGVSAVLINDMHCQRCRDYNFDWNQALQFKGDSGISLQYFHARLTQIERNCGVSLDLDCDTSTLVEREALELVIALSSLDQVLYDCHEELEPCILVKYLFTLRHAIGRAYKVLQVKNQEPAVAQARLLLYHVSKKVLSKGMKILGLRPLEKM